MYQLIMDFLVDDVDNLNSGMQEQDMKQQQNPPPKKRRKKSSYKPMALVIDGVRQELKRRNDISLEKLTTCKITTCKKKTKIRTG